ncbi:Uncharacterised protein [Helicobacter pylori]|uniref:Uncharacterized protein n=1 Tax=Helicobacter pylori TaxID=210 RepID=A0A377RTI0_HELPX|nr:Uncharacterised protein [Helicobacter pylori]
MRVQILNEPRPKHQGLSFVQLNANLRHETTLHFG